MNENERMFERKLDAILEAVHTLGNTVTGMCVREKHIDAAIVDLKNRVLALESSKGKWLDKIIYIILAAALGAWLMSMFQ